MRIQVSACFVQTASVRDFNMGNVAPCAMTYQLNEGRQPSANQRCGQSNSEFFGPGLICLALKPWLLPGHGFCFNPHHTSLGVYGWAVDLKPSKNCPYFSGTTGETPGTYELNLNLCWGVAKSCFKFHNFFCIVFWIYGVYFFFAACAPFFQPSKRKTVCFFVIALYAV